MKNTEIESYRKAFSELSKIIEMLDENISKRIPINFIKFIEENKSEDYIVSEDDIINEKILPETADLVALVYRDFLCDEEECECLKKQEELDSQKRRIEYTNLLAQKMNRHINDDSTMMVENISQSNQIEKISNIKWYTKIFNKIKSFLKI